MYFLEGVRQEMSINETELPPGDLGGCKMSWNKAGGQERRERAGRHREHSPAGDCTSFHPSYPLCLLIFSLPLSISISSPASPNFPLPGTPGMMA